MNIYKIKQINPDEYGVIRKLDREAFGYGKFDGSGDFHEVFADNVRRSPYYIPELDLAAVSNDGIYLGHAIFSALPMGDKGEHIIWLNSLAVKRGENDSHTEKSYEYQRKGIGTALVMHGLKIAKSLGYTGCMTCGHPDVYQKKMGFLDCRVLGINLDESVKDPEGCVHAVELVPGGFDKTNKIISYKYYNFDLNEHGINFEDLHDVLNIMFKKRFTRITCQAKQLQGGTVGDVRLVTGAAETADGEKMPYKIILKVQKKWARQDDPNSWRREYDLYKSDLGALFADSLRWPKCYHAEMNDENNETQLWMEYINGISGRDLTIEMREQAALELGRFQGRIYKRNFPLLQNLSCFSKLEIVTDYYMNVYRNTAEYRYIRSEDCEIPNYIKQMFITIDNQRKTILENIPVILCHRDFWFENIFYSDAKIRLIDWDSSGFGYIGDDIVQLITDETDAIYFDEYYRKFIPAYIKGFSEYADISWVDNFYIWERIVIHFGYSLVKSYMSAESLDEKKSAIDTLQKIYEMREIQWN